MFYLLVVVSVLEKINNPQKHIGRALPVYADLTEISFFCVISSHGPLFKNVCLGIKYLVRFLKTWIDIFNIYSVI